tara:strand:- start:4020 stop:4127 length:108 start_codon:yes stop_codon:yes gene_type:complete
MSLETWLLSGILRVVIAISNRVNEVTKIIKKNDKD